MDYSSPSVQRNNIEKILLLFCQLTKVNISFVNDSLQFFDRKRNVSDLQKINNLFAEKALVFFPLVTNQQVSGIFIANISSNSAEILNLYKASLESIAKKVLGVYFQSIAILRPLRINQLNKEILLLQFISSNYHGKNVPYSKEKKAGEKVELENINNALDYAESRISQKITLADVSKHTFLSLAYLSRLFKKYFLVNFSEYIRLRKIALAQEKLILTDESINSISQKIGFSRASYFNKVFKEIAGITPLQFRKRYKSKKVYTIHREVNWKKNVSAYAMSQYYFQKNGIPIETQNLNGSPYISAIGNLAALNGNSGWVYLIDGRQSNVLPSNMYIKDKSTIQWIYIDF